MTYSREIETPKTMRDGLSNFVQMIINSIEAGDTREALLKAVDLRQDIDSGIYDSAMTDAASFQSQINELEDRNASAVIEAHKRGVVEGIEQEKARMSQALGLMTNNQAA